MRSLIIDSDEAVINYTLFIMTTMVFLMSATLFTIRMGIQPIKARSPILSLISSCAGYLIITGIFASRFHTGVEDWPCSLSHWTLWLLYPCFFLPYSLRGFRCYMLWELARIRMKKFETDANKRSSDERQPLTQSIPLQHDNGMRSANYPGPPSIQPLSSPRNRSQTTAGRPVGPWRMALDESNRKYYYNPLTMETQWTAPPSDRGLIAPAPPPGTPSLSPPDVSAGSTARRAAIAKSMMPSASLSKVSSPNPKYSKAKTKNKKAKIHMRLFNRVCLLLFGPADKNAFDARVYAFVLCCCVIIGSIRFVAVSNVDETGCISKDGNLGYLAIFSLFIVVDIFVIFKLRNVRDEYAIRKELKAICITWTVLLTPHIILIILSNKKCDYAVDSSSSSCGYFETGQWLLIVVIWLSYIISVCYPLWITLRIGARSIKETDDSAMERVEDTTDGLKVVKSLENVLSHEKGKIYFKRFMIQEFRIANLLLFFELENFKLMADPHFKPVQNCATLTSWQKITGNVPPSNISRKGRKIAFRHSRTDENMAKLHATAIRLYRTYISTHSSATVKLPKTLVQELGQSLRANTEALGLQKDFVVQPDVLFDNIRQTLFNSMKTGPFVRFLRSQECVKLIEEVRTSNDTHEMLQKAGMI